MSTSGKPARRLLTAVLFLAPNIIGVLTFVIFPVIFAIMLAFTNWDLRLHNMFKDNPLHFVGLGNFITLIKQGDFLRFLGNTLYLMIAIPINVAASLVAAILLSKETHGGGGRVWLMLILGGVLVASCALLAVLGLGGSAMTILLCGLGAAIFLGGITGGNTIYRTLFYCPNFVAGVATFILWQKLYNPQSGPINNALLPALGGVTSAVNAVPAVLIHGIGWVLFTLMFVVLAWGADRLRCMWRDGDLGSRSLTMPLLVIAIPTVVATFWSTVHPASYVLAAAAVGLLVYEAVAFARGREIKATNQSEGFGSALMLAMVVLVGQFVLLGLAAVFKYLPEMAAASGGLQPPQWLASYEWAKPSLMMMGMWAAIGSNNMLLYLAALTNVPPELYEAADIDGASRFQRFWHVTWPQLAPTTFFIAVMSTIGGLQGGFEMARTMTQGGPAGSTTTLSYFIYQQGFETGRLGFASAAAWTLFVLVFAITMFNWRFGNQYVND